MLLRLEECNTPEVYAAVKKYYDGLKTIGTDYKLPNQFVVHLAYPYGGTGSGDGQLSLKVDSISSPFAYVNIDGFTGNCGIRALTSVRCHIPELAKLWITIIESKLALDGFSVAVGSDGSQGGYATKTTLEKVDRGWQFINLSQNRRTKLTDILVLIYKNLPVSLAGEIKWENAKSITQT